MNLIQLLAAAWPPPQWSDLTVVIAVSGGPDSVALLRAMVELKTKAGGLGRLVVGHFNHRLRPEADDEEMFVVNLAKCLGVAIEQGRAEVGQLAKLQGDGLEAAARAARYAFLQEASEKRGARYVVTAHTADDQLETVLFNILRGTGLAGLAGMERARLLGPSVTLIRPLLGVRRTEVLAYLDAIGQPYCTDPTNFGSDFTRSRLRNELLPLLREKFNPDVDSAVHRLSQLASDAQRLIERLAEELLERCMDTNQIPETVVPGLVTLNVKTLSGVDRHLIREMFVALWRRMNWPLQNMGFAEWDCLAAMVADAEITKPQSSQPWAATKRTFPGNIEAQRCGHAFKLRRQQ